MARADAGGRRNVTEEVDAMAVQRETGFLNIDLLVVGRFDPAPLVAAAGKQVFALGEHGPVDATGNEGLVFEVNAPNLDLPRTLRSLVRWAEGLPPAARRNWEAASRRIFDIGIQGGLEPRVVQWAIPPALVASVAKLGGEIVLTTYGANEGERPAPKVPSRKAADRPPRSQRRRGRPRG
jgi:hypothetical protein